MLFWKCLGVGKTQLSKKLSLTVTTSGREGKMSVSFSLHCYSQNIATDNRSHKWTTCWEERRDQRFFCGVQAPQHPLLPACRIGLSFQVEEGLVDTGGRVNLSACHKHGHRWVQHTTVLISPASHIQRSAATTTAGRRGGKQVAHVLPHHKSDNRPEVQELCVPSAVRVQQSAAHVAYAAVTQFHTENYTSHTKGAATTSAAHTERASATCYTTAYTNATA